MFGAIRDNGQATNGTIEKYYGKYPGVVVSNEALDDAEHHRGELLVQVPGILEETSDGSGQQPIEVIARPCFHPGFFFIPEIDAHVWVEFVAGDINSPVWTGVWYPNDATPLTQDDEAPTEFQKIVRTASGHVIQIDDTGDARKIIIHHRAGSFLSIDDEGHILLEHKDGMTIELTADNSIAITCDTLNITAAVNIEGEVTITGNTTIESDLTVGTGPVTTISGNEISGG